MKSKALIPWFVAADVCRALDVRNGRDAVTRLDEDEKAAVGLTDISSNGVKQQREYTIVNEAGLYSLILGSRKPQARAFKRWITHEVIPTIRKVQKLNKKLVSDFSTEKPLPHKHFTTHYMNARKDNEYARIYQRDSILPTHIGYCTITGNA